MLSLAFPLVLALTPDAAARTSKSPIKPAEVQTAQQEWCAGLLRISAAAASGGDAKGVAEAVVTDAYGHDLGTVLFKPTLAHGEQTFRFDREGALAYFVGGNPAYPDDSGFALKGWTTCEPTVKGVVSQAGMAVAMGNVRLVDAKGHEVTVDKTFGYTRDSEGKVRIVLHHSSLPYTPSS